MVAPVLARLAWAEVSGALAEVLGGALAVGLGTTPVLRGWREEALVAPQAASTTAKTATAAAAAAPVVLMTLLTLGRPSRFLLATPVPLPPVGGAKGRGGSGCSMRSADS